MYEIIAWANLNTGFLMAVITAVYVIATIWIVYESRRNNRLMSRFEKDRARPHVIFWVEAEMQTHGQDFTLIEFVGKVRNEGASTAHDVKISTIPKIFARQGIDKVESSYYTPSFLEEDTSILVPKQMLAETIGPTEFFLKDNDDEDLKFDVEIEYKDMNGEKYSSKYKIDLSRNKRKLFSEDNQAKAFFELVENVSKAAVSLADINITLNQPDRSNLFQREVDLKLSNSQVELLDRIIQAERDDEPSDKVWFLSRVIGKTSIQKHSPKGEIKLDASVQDIQALCQAGHLRGYYSGDILWFNLAPSAEGKK